jgi:hypothetical protein
MLKKAALVLVLVGCTLATPATASAASSPYAQVAFNYLAAALEYADAGDWYNASFYAEEGSNYAEMDYSDTGSPEAYYAYYYAYYASYYSWLAYVYGHSYDKEDADRYMTSAFYYAFYSYFGYYPY